MKPREERTRRKRSWQTKKGAVMMMKIKKTRLSQGSEARRSCPRRDGSDNFLTANMEELIKQNELFLSSVSTKSGQGKWADTAVHFTEKTCRRKLKLLWRALGHISFYFKQKTILTNTMFRVDRQYQECATQLKKMSSLCK